MNRLRNRGALQRLELDEGKLSRPVLRGGGGGNVTSLPDPCLKLQIGDERLLRDVKIIASNFSHFANVTVQIDDAICNVKLIMSACSFL